MVVVSPAALTPPAVVEANPAIQPVALPQGQQGTDIFNYALPLQPGHRSIADYTPGLKAKLMANPAAIGDQLLGSLQQMHKEMKSFKIDYLDSPLRDSASQTTQSSANPRGPANLRGPAEAHPGRQQDTPEGILATFREQSREILRTNIQFSGQMVKVTLVSTGAKQLSNVPETLLRG